jgi:hypothetical protein
MSTCAGGDLGIERVDTRGVDPDQDLPLAGNRAGDVAHGQRGLGGLGDSGKHLAFHDRNLAEVDAYRLPRLIHSDKKLNFYIIYSS